MRSSKTTRVDGKPAAGGKAAGAVPDRAQAGETVVEDTWWLPAEDE